MNQKKNDFVVNDANCFISAIYFVSFGIIDDKYVCDRDFIKLSFNR